ncbi:hypothetical protein CAPTEDRAFT_101771 [Capitella teleta]|uniref:Protein xylosyltransferase n=1 Tax=Capitella teleta TaxID=283909 RepID=R7U9R5_CAPTE|nr:hypothetical protein CAPTEDRAFT_101771 [Capitella teleta]|eukprot:ELU03105.1 hypothetical protein CAPTEDRAFT_101771 [Capitella teleta]
MIFKESRKVLRDQDYIIATNNCSGFIQSRNYPMQPFSEEEEHFPLAYILTVHKNSEQVERLLRAVYTPQNVYCIHVDTKATQSFQDAISSIVACLPNVFLVSKAVDIVYAGYSRLQADINCMEDLMGASTQWKYAVNLCGQDFPMQTNLALVHYLKSLNGRNDIAGVIAPEKKLIDRYKFKHKVVNVGGTSQIQMTQQLNKDPPHGYKIHFGTAYNFFSREFVDFVTSSQEAQDLLMWMQDVYSPDEYYWPTLQYSPGTPGGRTAPSWQSAVKIIKWKFFSPEKYPACAGYYQREICVYGVGDLNWLFLQGNFFANKFDLDYDHVTVRCLEQMLKGKVVEQVYPKTGSEGILNPEKTFSILVKQSYSTV